MRKESILKNVAAVMIGAICMIQAAPIYAYTGFAKKGIQPEEYLQMDNLCDIEFVYGADFDTIDYTDVKLTLSNCKDNNYYDVIMENVGQDDFLTQLPAGTYELYCTYYDNRTNLNYNTRLEPETFELTEAGVITENGTNECVYVYTDIELQSVYMNEYIPKFTVCGDEQFNGTVNLCLKGQSLSNDKMEETYEISIKDVRKTSSIEMKVGEYHIEKIEAVDEDGNMWNVCYNDNTTHINFNKGTERNFLLYRDAKDIPLEYADRVLDEGTDWKVTQDSDIAVLENQIEQVTSEVEEMLEAEHEENESIAETEETDSVVDETEAKPQEENTTESRNNKFGIWCMAIMACVVLGTWYFKKKKK